MSKKAKAVMWTTSWSKDGTPKTTGPVPLKVRAYPETKKLEGPKRRRKSA